jgi:hypothetical protein
VPELLPELLPEPLLPESLPEPLLPESLPEPLLPESLPEPLLPESLPEPLLLCLSASTQRKSGAKHISTFKVHRPEPRLCSAPQ